MSADYDERLFRLPPTPNDRRLRREHAQRAQSALFELADAPVCPVCPVCAGTHTGHCRHGSAPRLAGADDDDGSGAAGAAECLGTRRARADESASEIAGHRHHLLPDIQSPQGENGGTLVSMNTEPMSSVDVRAELAAAGRPVIVAMSRGKDSLCVWTSLLDAGVECIPVHLDLIPPGIDTPGLKFVDQSIADLEQHFQCRIHRLPHPSFHRWLVNHVYQAPERLGVIEAAAIADYDYDDVWAKFRESMGLPADTWTAVGTRAADSPMRRVAMSSYGPWRHRKPGTNQRGRTWRPDPGKWEVHAVWDWRIADVRRQLGWPGTKTAHKVPQPIDYQWFGRSFDGLDERFLRPIRDNAPDDYETIVRWFPLAPLTIMRADMERTYLTKQGA